MNLRYLLLSSLAVLLLLPGCKPEGTTAATAPTPPPLTITVAATTSRIPAHHVEGDAAVSEWLFQHGRDTTGIPIPIEFIFDPDLPYKRVEQFLIYGGQGGMTNMLLKLRDDPDPGILIELPCCCEERWLFTLFAEAPWEQPPFDHFDPKTGARHLKFDVDPEGNLFAESDLTPEEFSIHLRDLRSTHDRIAVHLELTEEDIQAKPIFHLLRIARDHGCKFSVPYKPDHTPDLSANPSPVSGGLTRPLHPFSSTTTVHPVPIPVPQEK